MKSRYLISASILVIAVMVTASFMSRKRAVGTDDHNKQKQYVCSMHPQVLRDSPGDCPICGMFLIEVVDSGNKYDSALADVTGSVNESVLGSAQTITPLSNDLPVAIEALGVLNFDPAKTYVISARFGGIVEKSFVKYRFQHIKKDQKIFSIYSPDMYNERWNYVKLVQSYPTRDDLTAEAIEWLRGLGLDNNQIDSLKHSVSPEFHLPVYSPAEGYVLSINEEFREGSVISTGVPLFTLVSNESLQADIFVKSEYVPLVKKGQKIILRQSSFDEKSINAVVELISPFNDGLFTIRTYLKEIPESFQPGKQLNASILAESCTGLWIPSSAVLETGYHNYVFLKQANRFVATEVRTGIKTGKYTEILYGIHENSEIAIRPALLIDSDGLISF